MPARLLIIIPVYNEEKHISSVLDEVRAVFGAKADILVINDHSTDRSLEIIRTRKADCVDLIMRVKYGAVLQTGFKYADLMGYEYVASIDGDGQHVAVFMKEMLALLESGNADLVIGSRFITDTGYRMPFLRRVGSRLFSGLVRLLSGQKIFDPTSGYQMFDRKVLRVYCSDDYPADYPDADVILRLLFQGLKVREIPVKMRPNPEKSMHSGLGVFYYVIKMFLSILVVFLSAGDLRKGRDNAD